MWDMERNADNWQWAYSLIKIPWNFRGLIGYSSEPSALRLEFWFQEKYSSILLELLVFNLEHLFVFCSIHKMVRGKESFSGFVKMRSLWGTWKISGKSQEIWSDNKRRNITFCRTRQYRQRNRFHVWKFSDFQLLYSRSSCSFGITYHMQFLCLVDYKLDIFLTRSRGVFN